MTTEERNLVEELQQEIADVNAMGEEEFYSKYPEFADKQELLATLDSEIDYLIDEEDTDEEHYMTDEEYWGNYGFRDSVDYYTYRL